MSKSICVCGPSTRNYISTLFILLKQYLLTTLIHIKGLIPINGLRALFFFLFIAEVPYFLREYWKIKLSGLEHVPWRWSKYFSYLLRPEYFRFWTALHVFKLSVHDEIKKLYYSSNSYVFDILNILLGLLL